MLRRVSVALFLSLGGITMAFQLISHLRLRPHYGYGVKHALCGAKDGDTEELIDRLKGTCIHLVGMTGCGKSTVAESLAKELRYRFLDTDQLVEYMIEMPITDYFKQEGELSFRIIEHQVLSQLTQYTRVVVATGGGIVTNRENWGLLQQGVVVYLDLSPQHIYERLIHNPEEVSKRPLLHAGDPLQSLQELNTARKDLYLQADIHCVVNPAHTPEQTAQRVVEHLQRFLDANPPRWRTWKEQRQAKANEMAAVINPGVARSVQQAQGEEVGRSPKGSVQYVPLSDVLSGKVSLPYKHGNSSDNRS